MTLSKTNSHFPHNNNHQFTAKLSSLPSLVNNKIKTYISLEDPKTRHGTKHCCIDYQPKGAQIPHNLWSAQGNPSSLTIFRQQLVCTLCYVSILKNIIPNAMFTISTNITSCWRENQSWKYEESGKIMQLVDQIFNIKTFIKEKSHGLYLQY